MIPQNQYLQRNLKILLIIREENKFPKNINHFINDKANRHIFTFLNKFLDFFLDLHIKHIKKR